MPFKPTWPRSKRIFAILALALVAYWPTLHVGFLWDDHVMIESNPALRSWSLQNLKHDFTTDVFDGFGDAYYRPGQTLLNRLDYTLWGLRPLGYHATNWMGHAVNAILVGELAIALGLGGLVALLAGALFAVHPIVVEQLMIIAGRAEILSLTFTLSCLLLLLREEKWAWGLGYISFFIALLFKESAVITPLLIACVLAFQDSPRSRYLRLLPLPLLMVPYLLLRHAAVGALIPRITWHYIPPFFTLAFAHVVVIYLSLLFIPWNLHSHRMMPHLTHDWPALLALLIGLPIYLYRKGYRLSLFGFAWFILALLPKVPVMIYGNFMLDHWAYPASIGLFLPLATGFDRLWAGRASPWRYWLGLAVFPLLIFWALLVHLNVALRNTDEKMYRWALDFSESHPIQYNLAMLLIQTGRPREALPYLYNYLDANPNDPHAKAALAHVLQELRAAHRRPPSR